MAPIPFSNTPTRCQILLLGKRIKDLTPILENTPWQNTQYRWAEHAPLATPNCDLLLMIIDENAIDDPNALQAQIAQYQAQSVFVLGLLLRHHTSQKDPTPYAEQLDAFFILRQGKRPLVKQVWQHLAALNRMFHLPNKMIGIDWHDLQTLSKTHRHLKLHTVYSNDHDHQIKHVLWQLSDAFREWQRLSPNGCGMANICAEAEFDLQDFEAFGKGIRAAMSIDPFVLGFHAKDPQCQPNTFDLILARPSRAPYLS